MTTQQRIHELRQAKVIFTKGPDQSWRLSSLIFSVGSLTIVESSMFFWDDCCTIRTVCKSDVTQD